MKFALNVFDAKKLENRAILPLNESVEENIPSRCEILNESI